MRQQSSRIHKVGRVGLVFSHVSVRTMMISGDNVSAEVVKVSHETHPKDHHGEVEYVLACTVVSLWLSAQTETKLSLRTEL